jgi:hypothetical protein
MMSFPEVHSGEMTSIKPNTLGKDLELVMECTANGYPTQCMMRFPEVYSGKMTPIKPNTLEKDLELVMECTTNGYPN